MGKSLIVELDTNKASKILNELKSGAANSQEVMFLGEDWIDGYKSGYIDMLLILGITVDELKKLLNNEKE